ncbi:MAG: STAS domain-containing protein [Gemmataceae bacterium]|nr:STAS domain-containing protein [Gemmataceae bacterium]
MLKLTVVADEGDVVRVQCEGEISQVKFQLNDNPLEALLGPSVYSRKLLVNLERVEFLDSSGISWLVVSHKNFQQGGGILVLYSIPPRITQVLQFCRMDRLLKMVEDEPAARTLIAGGKPS